MKSLDDRFLSRRCSSVFKSFSSKNLSNNLLDAYLMKICQDSLSSEFQYAVFHQVTSPVILLDRFFTSSEASSDFKRFSSKWLSSDLLDDSLDAFSSSDFLLDNT